ncbi:MAG: phosphoribosylaminoimidazolesuccinocarboxamide synthase [Deltaproteobacteria bacterium]|nr:phosphoribosylaminoimidazolesuccinocarboxamide synthase [Deltaproteobacteria bacterium]
MENKGLLNSHFEGLTKVSQGKVRDIYAVDPYLLIVTTDRISAFDVIMPNPVPGKGEVLTRMSAFWFEKMKDIIPNHLVSIDPDTYPAACAPYKEALRGRSMLVKKAKPLPVECIVRGYLSGSGWKDYSEGRPVSGITLPPGLKESSRLPQTIFTPSTKAPDGQHDLPISRQEMEKLIGAELTAEVVRATVAIYERAVGIAAASGIIIADTKMEFGVLDGRLILIDELLTPDSSRFWPQDDYAEGRAQKSFDKQFLRDYLLSIGWEQKPPAPELPEAIIAKTGEKYREALNRLLK